VLTKKRLVQDATQRGGVDDPHPAHCWRDDFENLKI